MILIGGSGSTRGCEVRPIITIDLAKNGINFENNNGDGNTLILSLKQSN